MAEINAEDVGFVISTAEANELAQEIEDSLVAVGSQTSGMLSGVKFTDFSDLDTVVIFPPSTSSTASTVSMNWYGTISNGYKRGNVTFSFLYDGLTLSQCFDAYEAGMRGEGGNKLTAGQLAVAKGEWSRRLKKKAAEKKLAERNQVLVDIED